MTDQETSPGAGSTVPALQTEFTVGGRTYELVPFLKEDESSVTGDTMFERAVKLNANLGEEDGTFILKHQDEIPPEFRGKIYLVFANWRGPASPQGVAYLSGRGIRWDQIWRWLGYDWDANARLVRRVS